MGMYTEIFVNISIEESKISTLLLKALYHMFDENYKSLTEDDKVALQDVHPLFKTKRWEQIGSCSSYYFTPMNTSKIEVDRIGKYVCIHSISSIKNYDSEGELLFNLLSPLSYHEGLIGYTRYEESPDKPVLYFSEDNYV